MSALGIAWATVKLVVFDVDGTLYDARRLRRRMAGSLLLHCLTHPQDLGVPRILLEFRRCREHLAEQERTGIDRLQYTETASRLALDPEQVRQVVEEWFFQRPLPHLEACRFPGVKTLFAKLAEKDKRVAVLSDYPADRKLAAMGLAADPTVSGMDPEVNRLKPHPAGLARVLHLAGVEARECLLIGDREVRDGACARRLGAACLIKSRVSGGGSGTFRDYREILSSLEAVGAAASRGSGADG